MPGTTLDFPFDSEIFNYKWKTTPDVKLLTMLTSGAMVEDAEIAALIANGSNLFTTPFYNDIAETASGVYNGKNDITTESVTGGYMSGVVFGRQKGWNAKSFIKDFNSGADPMGYMATKVATYWNRERQARLIKILEAVFGITGNADWTKHTLNLATKTASVADENKIGVSTIDDLCVQANGDMADGYSLAIMHSAVLQRLKTLQLIDYKKYTDPSGITGDLNIPTINGKLIVVNDNVPVADSSSASAAGGKEYTTYVLGAGAIRHANAPVDVPSEMDRDPAKYGGQDFLYTRVREVIHPNGFSFKGDATTDVGIPDTVLESKDSYEIKMPAKSIYMAKLITNG